LQPVLKLSQPKELNFCNAKRPSQTRSAPLLMPMELILKTCQFLTREVMHRKKKEISIPKSFLPSGAVAASMPMRPRRS